jgi:hypothetical protein
MHKDIMRIQRSTGPAGGAFAFVRPIVTSQPRGAMGSVK